MSDDETYDRECPMCGDVIEHESQAILPDKEMPAVERKLADDKLKHHIRNEHSKVRMLLHSIRRRIPL